MSKTTVTNTGVLQFTASGASFEQSDNHCLELQDSPVEFVTVIKEADQDTAYVGSVINYTFTIMVDDSFTDMDYAVFTDELEPHLELVEGSVTFNGIAMPEVTAPIEIKVDGLKSGTTTTITYQCIVVEVEGNYS